jgi:hypothetical protein
MPGMARLMHRPAYDFAKSYGYNRSRRRSVVITATWSSKILAR